MSVEINETVFEETEKILTEVGKNRNNYINEAIAFYNLLQKRRIVNVENED